MTASAPNYYELPDSVEPDHYTAIAALLQTRPKNGTFRTSTDYEAARVTWLFDMANALKTAGLNQDAKSVHDTALHQVHTAVNALTSEPVRPS